MNKNEQRPNELILEQSSKPDVPETQKTLYSDQSLLELIVKTSGATKSDSVLDIGCGSGSVSFEFAKIAQRVVGIDIKPEMIERAKEIQKGNNIDNIEWIIGDATKLQCDDSMFSMVITRFAAHHFLSPQIVINEMIRVCKPEGTIIVSDICPLKQNQDAYNRFEKMLNPLHNNSLTPEELLSIAHKANLKDIKTYFYRLDKELESTVRASFPNSKDADKIRRIFKNDLQNNLLGLDIHLIEDQIHFSYPITVIIGKK